MNKDKSIQPNPHATIFNKHEGMTLWEYSVIENHAQLIRFVRRNQMTSEEAAALAMKHANALFEEEND